MKLDTTFELIDDETNKGLRFRKIQQANGNTKAFLEWFDEHGVYSREKLTKAYLSDILYILKTGKLPERMKS